jgi:hypothetical protein
MKGGVWLTMSWSLQNFSVLICSWLYDSYFISSYIHTYLRM